MTVWRSSFSDGAPGSWAANGEIATRRGRASRRHPGRHEVPLGTRGLGFSWQSSAVVFRLLFLEATQLISVRTVVVALRIEPGRIEVRTVGVVTVGDRCRRPAESVVADAIHFSAGFDASPAAFAPARGRVLLGTPTGRFVGLFTADFHRRILLLGTRRPGFCAAGTCTTLCRSKSV